MRLPLGFWGKKGSPLVVVFLVEAEEPVKKYLRAGGVLDELSAHLKDVRERDGGHFLLRRGVGEGLGLAEAVKEAEEVTPGGGLGFGAFRFQRKESS